MRPLVNLRSYRQSRYMSIEVIETGSFAVREVTRKRPERIRVVSWNVARGTRLEEIIDFLAAASAEIILLQETDRNARRTGLRNVAAEIATALKMNYVFGVEFEELAEGCRASRAYHGQATLSVLPLSDCRILRFRAQSRFWHPYWWIPRIPKFERRVGGRMALLSHVWLGEATLPVYNLHLESRSDSVREAQFAELLRDTSRYGSQTPVMLAGDFNFDVTENSAASVIEDAQFQNPFRVQRRATARARLLSRGVAIDWMLIKGPLQASAAEVHSSISASDHYPLSLTLQLA
jgi:endonuclease/exonuclease/phosphatase family metal-dependent hydrolase